MKALNRKQLLTLGFGLWALGFGLLGTEARADSFNNFYNAENVIVTAHFTPWSTNVSGELDLLKTYPLLQKKNLQKIAFDYVQSNLDKKLAKCVKVISPDNWSDYAADYNNLFFTIEYGLTPLQVDGKTKAIASLYLKVDRPKTNGGLNYLSSGEDMPTQAVLLTDNQSQLQKDISVAIERILTQRVSRISSPKKCGGS